MPQLLQGPAQFAALQVPTQAPPWHSARLPAQVSGVQIGVQVPALHCPFGHPVPGGASTHWSITQARQGAGQLLLVQLLPRQMPASAQFGAVAGQDSGRSTQAPEASQTRRMRVPVPPQRALPHEEFRGSRRQPPAPSQPLVQAPSLRRPAGIGAPGGHVGAGALPPGQRAGAAGPVAGVVAAATLGAVVRWRIRCRGCRSRRRAACRSRRRCRHCPPSTGRRCRSWCGSRCRCSRGRARRCGPRATRHAPSSQVRRRRLVVGRVAARLAGRRCRSR